MSRVRRADAAGLAAAVGALRAGELVGMPTETVYGLAAIIDPAHPDAVERIFTAKGRPADNPLIVHLEAMESLGGVARTVTPLAHRLATACWPGPLTLVLDASDAVPRTVTAGLDTVAVRVPDHPVALALLRELDAPIAAPSANRSGRPSPTLAAHVEAEFGAEVALVLDGGPADIGLESTVVDVRGEVPVVLRPGAIDAEMLAEIAGGVDHATSPASTSASPGTRYRHYAPDCRVHLLAPDSAVSFASDIAASGAAVGLVAAGLEDLDRRVTVLARPTDAADLARVLYASLREAEVLGLDDLVVASVEETGIGRAVMDRLRRAAGRR
ncbi:MAG: threonylcarbamoyl-AMP synthase [Nitriliruptoraceae bacterium]|nr:threonylcarbamoyl-AMP synthase [Nitriliruptoraceae bacterium]